jgi:excisionase family DNA binding protein
VDVENLLERFFSLKERQRTAEFLSVKEIAAQLNLHPSRVRQLVDEGKLPSVKIFGRIYVHRPSMMQTLKALAAEQEITSTPNRALRSRDYKGRDGHASPISQHEIK